MIVRIGGQELRPFGHSPAQRTVIGMPPRTHVIIVDRRVRPHQILSNRPSYINALLISSRGVWQPDACTACRAKIEADPNGYASPFAFCVRIVGQFGGACNNCKWLDHGARCSFHGVDDNALPAAGGRGPDDEDEDDDESGAAGGASRTNIRGLIGSGSAANPIILDDGSAANPIVLD
jgi:hypothetical protein